MKVLDLLLACLFGGGVYVAIGAAYFHQPELVAASLAISALAGILLLTTRKGD